MSLIHIVFLYIMQKICMNVRQSYFDRASDPKIKAKIMASIVIFELKLVQVVINMTASKFLNIVVI